MRLEEVTEEETLADGTLYKLYMMNVYALEQLAKIDLSVSTEACKDFVSFFDYHIKDMGTGEVVRITPYERFVLYALHDLSTRVTAITPELLLSVIHTSEIEEFEIEQVEKMTKLLEKFSNLLFSHTYDINYKGYKKMEVSDSPMSKSLTFGDSKIFFLEPMEDCLPTVYTPNSFVLYVQKGV